MKENLKVYKNKKLIDYTINAAKKSKFINDIYVAAQNNSVKNYIKSKKNIKLIPRPVGYSEDYIGVIDVLKFSQKVLCHFLNFVAVTPTAAPAIVNELYFPESFLFFK